MKLEKIKNKKRPSLKDLKKELMQDKEFAKGYKRQELINKITYRLVKERQKRNLTQKEFAELLDTKQSAISRAERGESLLSLEFLYKMTETLGLNLKVSF